MPAGSCPVAKRSLLVYGMGIRSTEEHIMGKYVLAWALGVPGVIVVIAYLLFG
jgi:hypothetical protein